MIRVLFLIVLLTTSHTIFSQPIQKTVYPVVISFHSECCGVPSDSSLRIFIDHFKKHYKIKRITADYIGPMGREGEYYLGFKLRELNKKQAGYFKTKVKKIKKLPGENGSLVVRLKMEIDPQSLPGRAASNKILF
ncbi:MAG: hypothetical protein ABIO04_09295 [Ferruginibacter sp.]